MRVARVSSGYLESNCCRVMAMTSEASLESATAFRSMRGDETMRHLLAASLLSCSTLFASVSAQTAQPLVLIVPYSAGGNVDTAGRLIAPGLSAALGQSVIVENKPGAGGMIAAEYVARSRPDGNTVFLSSNGPILHSPIIYSRPVYDWKKDFIPVGSVSFTPMVLLAANTAPFRNLRTLKEIAGKSPGTVSIATPGMGSTNHLMAELLQEEMQVKLNTVHYKGTAPATSDLLGGHVMLSFDQINVALPRIQQGSTLPLAVTTLERLPQLPDVPTFKELGINIGAASFVGIFAPAGTSQDRIKELSNALSTTLSNSDTALSFSKQGSQAKALSPKLFREYLENEDKIWLPIIERTITQPAKKG